MTGVFAPWTDVLNQYLVGAVINRPCSIVFRIRIGSRRIQSACCRAIDNRPYDQVFTAENLFVPLRGPTVRENFPQKNMPISCFCFSLFFVIFLFDFQQKFLVFYG